MKVKCPACNKPTQWTGNEFRPFCSERCKLLDLGKWLNEEYGVPVSDEKRKSFLLDDNLDE